MNSRGKRCSYLLQKMQNFSNVCWSSSSWHIINLLTRKTIPKKGHKAPVTDRDGCIDGAEDGQVHPNPLEDAPTPDFEGADQVPTPSPKDMVWIRRKRQSTDIKFKHSFLLQIVLLAIEKKKTIPCSGHMLQVGHCHDPSINEKAQNGTCLRSVQHYTL